MKKTIRDTVVFDLLGLENTVKRCAAINADLAKNAIPSESSDMILNEIKYKVSLPMKANVVEAIRNGTIVFVDSPECASLQTWMVADGKGGIKHAVVNLFGKIKIKNGITTFNSREVFALCILGMAVKGFYEAEPKIVNNLNITRLASEIYVKMFYRVLDVLYSVGTSAVVASQVTNYIRIFFGSYVLEKPFSIAENKMDNIFTYTADASHRVLYPNPSPRAYFSQVDGDPLVDLKTFLEFLKTVSPLMRELDVTQFLRKFITMYGEKSLLMVETYQYFLAYVMTATVGGNLVKDFALEGAIGKNGLHLYNSFFDLTK